MRRSVQFFTEAMFLNVTGAIAGIVTGVFDPGICWSGFAPKRCGWEVDALQTNS